MCDGSLTANGGNADGPEAYSVGVSAKGDLSLHDGSLTTTFSPDDPCTRAQMVTFLYRFFVKE